MIIAARSSVFLVGGGVREAFRQPSAISPPHRSLMPDLITLVGLRDLLGIGVLGLAHARRRGVRDVDGMLDGVIAALAAMALAWIFLISPTLFHRTSSATRAVSLSCYPPLSVFIVAMIARLALNTGEAPPVVVRPPPRGGDGDGRRGRRLHAPRDPRGDAAPARVRRPLCARFCSVHRRRAPSVDARA